MDTLDWIGLGTWSGLWLVYQVMTERASAAKPNIATAIRPYRHAWMQQAYARENRVADAALVGNLMQSATFLASTTLLVLGGLFALVGGTDQSARLVQSLPFAQKTSAGLFELKAIVLAMVLVYALLRFTWSIRQFNLVVILLGAFPPAQKPGDPLPAAVHQAARLNELAGLNFTQGLRAYYYGVPVLLWLINPWMLIAGSVGVTAITYYMEFRSASVAALVHP